MVEMPGDLLGAAARGEMLGAVQRRPALFGGELEKVLRDERNGAACAAFPGGIGGGVHDDLTHDAPAGVMGLAAGDEEAREGFCQDRSVRFVAARVEMAQRLADVAAVFDGPRQLPRGAAGSPHGADCH